MKEIKECKTITLNFCKDELYYLYETASDDFIATQPHRFEKILGISSLAASDKRTMLFCSSYLNAKILYEILPSTAIYIDRSSSNYVVIIKLNIDIWTYKKFNINLRKRTEIV
jgi:hypothetical protein